MVVCCGVSVHLSEGVDVEYSEGEVGECEVSLGAAGWSDGGDGIIFSLRLLSANKVD